MTPKEIGMMIKSLRGGEKIICPKCKKGVIHPVGNYKTTSGFYCDNCKFKIHMEPIEKK